MSAIGTVDRVSRMLRSMGGGDGVFEDVEVAAVQTASVEICQLCSDTPRTMATAKKARQA